MAHDSNDFEALARQYWTMWGDAARNIPGVPGLGPTEPLGLQGFRDAMGAWTRNVGAGSDGINDVLADMKKHEDPAAAQLSQPTEDKPADSAHPAKRPQAQPA